MTREELKEHCKKQIEMCEMWAKHNREEPHGKIYEEHKLILELLEQESCTDAISRQAVKDMLMREWTKYIPMDLDVNLSFVLAKVDELLPVTPQYPEAEIQKMQELEQAEIQKAYELGKAEQPCEDAISRRGAIKKFTYNHKGERIPDYDCDNFPIQIDIKTVKEILRDLPPVNPQPKTGHWSRKTKVDAYDIAGAKTWGIKCQCDRCDFTTIVVEDFGYYNYCPNCGAKMVGSKAESEEK